MGMEGIHRAIYLPCSATLTTMPNAPTTRNDGQWTKASIDALIDMFLTLIYLIYLLP